MAPMGLALKQLVPQTPPAAGATVWVIGQNGSFVPTLFVLNAATLAVVNTIVATSPFDAGAYIDGCTDGTYIWVYADLGGTVGSVLQFSAAGSLLSTTSLGADSASTGGNGNIFYDGASTLYVTSPQGTIKAMNTGSLAVTTIVSGSQGFQNGSWDPTSSKLGISEVPVVVADYTRKYVYTIPGASLAYAAIAAGGANNSGPVCNGNGAFWSLDTDSEPSPTVYEILWWQGLTSTPAISVITPPTPTPPLVSFGQGNIAYDSVKNTVYVGYLYADSTKTNARVDAVNATSGAITTLINTLPTQGPTVNNPISIAASGNSLWATDGGQKVSVVDLTALTFSSVTLSGFDDPGRLIYLP